MTTKDKIQGLQEKLVAIRMNMEKTTGKDFEALSKRAAAVIISVKEVLKKSPRYPAMQAAKEILSASDEETKDWLEDNSFVDYGKLYSIALTYYPNLSDWEIELIDRAIEVQTCPDRIV
ncbi:hypothetical protein POF51_29685 [Brevibacillus sp. AG]|uniref:hypothetical protein n=1 Tax=Brevibacillus sp. AG TaxID=3020891 RepID=UPI00232C57AE|nr:hypothetical protein [Brevibacillus sp. AG]MDC0764896.1 hypothetical protein [Brevibacillus sp. AG]